MAFDLGYSIESVHSLMDSEEETDTYVDIACEDLDDTSMCHDTTRGENKKKKKEKEKLQQKAFSTFGEELLYNWKSLIFGRKYTT